jgi:oxalate decarboxylase/phosphoglucose isomerase-like protein (cupin superfamily)
MELKSARLVKDLRPVLTTKSEKILTSEDVVYWVFSGITNAAWENMTVLNPQKLDNEFPKTFGHYHTTNVIETYKLIHGEGLFQLQKRMSENNEWAIDKLEAVYFVRLDIGEEISITPEWGHSWSNIGTEPLVTFDNWRSGHTPQDYEPMEKLHGMGYYLSGKIDDIKIEPNPNYQSLPAPKVLTVKGFYQLTGRV